LVSVGRCASEGASLDDVSRVRDAEKDIRKLQKEADKLSGMRKEREERFNDILTFHQLVEEVQDLALQLPIIDSPPLIHNS